jgi:hypothetical protein
MPIGPALGADILNYALRGVVVAPPTELYASIGTYTAPTVTELTTPGRTMIRTNRGVFRSGTGVAGEELTNASVMMYSGEEYVIATNPATETASPRVVLWKAASGGSAYFIGSAGSLYPYANPNDLFSIDAGITGSVSTSTGIGLPTGGVIYTTSYIGPRFGAIVRDHFWCGVDMFGTYFSVGSFPDVYMTITSGSSWPLGTTYVPRFALPRSTATWSAPAVDASGYSYVTNAVDITTAAFTANMSSYAMYIHLCMNSAAPGYDDRLFYAYAFSELRPSGTAVLCQIGDQIVFPAGILKVGIG